MPKDTHIELAIADRPSDLRPRRDALKKEGDTLASEGKAQRGLPANDPRALDLEARVAALNDRRDELGDAASATGARDLADVLVLAEIVWDLHWGLRSLPSVLADMDESDRREVAVAQLVRGVVDVAQGQGGRTAAASPAQAVTFGTGFGATSAAAADVPALRIQQHTRHESADMVARYVRESDKWARSGLKGILRRPDAEPA